MRVLFEIPEGIFRRHKTEEQIAREMLFAAANLWLARGDISLEGYWEIVGPSSPPPGEALMKLFLTAPRVGETVGF